MKRTLIALGLTASMLAASACSVVSQIENERAPAARARHSVSRNDQRRSKAAASAENPGPHSASVSNVAQVIFHAEWTTIIPPR